MSYFGGEPFYNKGQDHAAYDWSPHVSAAWTEEQKSAYRKGYDDYHAGIVVDQRIHYEVGDRVMTSFGMGTVKGFEKFTKDGYAYPLQAKDDRNNRIAVALDPGHTWVSGHDVCYLHHKEIIR